MDYIAEINFDFSAISIYFVQFLPNSLLFQNL
jgi:hypothetical protein